MSANLEVLVSITSKSSRKWKAKESRSRAYCKRATYCQRKQWHIFISKHYLLEFWWRARLGDVRSHNRWFAVRLSDSVSTTRGFSDPQFEIAMHHHQALMQNNPPNNHTSNNSNILSTQVIGPQLVPSGDVLVYNFAQSMTLLALRLCNIPKPRLRLSD